MATDTLVVRRGETVVQDAMLLHIGFDPRAIASVDTKLARDATRLHHS